MPECPKATGVVTVETVANKWEAELMAILGPLVAALNQADATFGRKWAPALLSHADQFSAASRVLLHWSQEHPSPRPDVDANLARLSVHAAYAAQRFESVSKGSSLTWLVVDRELKRLHEAVATVVDHAPRAIVARLRNPKPGPRGQRWSSALATVVGPRQSPETIGQFEQPQQLNPKVHTLLTSAMPPGMARSPPVDRFPPSVI